MGKIKDYLIKFGLLKKSRIINDNCVNCGKKLVEKQLRFCSPNCCSYYHNVSTPIKQVRKEIDNNTKIIRRQNGY
jgi:uncharacterized Zn finger protein (UPF0148 family)